jgi:hypothetical protein
MHPSLRLAFFFLICTAATAAGAAGFGGNNELNEITKSYEKAPFRAPWIFIGCTKTKEQCEKMADFHGYDRSSLEYNPRLCIIHPHGGCFGWRKEGGVSLN